MEINLFGYELKIGKQKPKLQHLGANAKVSQSWEKLEKGLKKMLKNQVKYTDYRLSKESGTSINTVKKYRVKIDAYIEKNSRTLL